jgi:hypothetical protein
MAVGEIDLDEEDFPLMDELRGIRAKVINGSALQIEKKEDMKKRGAKSPDHADALWYGMVDSMNATTGVLPGETYQLDPEDYFDSEYAFFKADPNGW